MNASQEVNRDPAYTSTLSSTSDHNAIQISPFDPKLEFERRLSGKRNSAKCDVPVIVKDAAVRSKSCERRLGEITLQSSARLKSSDKPNFDFIIRKDDDDVSKSNANEILTNLFADASDSVTC